MRRTLISNSRASSTGILSHRSLACKLAPIDTKYCTTSYCILHTATRFTVWFLLTGQCVAVGECGLDYYVKPGKKTLLSAKEVQKPVFRAQCEMAKERRMPLVVHTRMAEEDTLDILMEVFDSDEIRAEQPIHIHCFTDSDWFSVLKIECLALRTSNSVVKGDQTFHLRQDRKWKLEGWECSI